MHCICLRRTPPVARLDFWTREFWGDHQRLREHHREELTAVLAGFSQVESCFLRIVGGDFNAPPLDPTLGVLASAGLTDAFAGQGVGLGGTGTNDYPLFRVDQIWTDSRVSQAFARKTKYSDHRMVVSDLIHSP